METIADGDTLLVTAGTGITAVVSATDTLTISNTGVTSAVASTGISVSGSTGAVTFTNSGVTSIVAGTNVSISGGTGAVTISSTDQFTGTVTSVATSSGTFVDVTGGTFTTSGTITVAGTLVVANGGTGATTASSARTNLEIFSGRFTQSVLAIPDPGIASITVTDSNVTATNTILYSIENPNGLVLPLGAGTVTTRSASTSFTIALDAVNLTAGNLDMFVNYTIIG